MYPVAALGRIAPNPHLRRNTLRRLRQEGARLRNCALRIRAPHGVFRHAPLRELDALRSDTDPQ
jgi:hypothetical protein